jgi:hypothetical protein
MATTPRDAAPAYSEAEKGLLEMPRLPEAAYPKDEKKDPFRDEKKGDISVNVVAEKKEARPAKPAPKPKKKVPKWILWQLWFNTYR